MCIYTYIYIYKYTCNDIAVFFLSEYRSLMRLCVTHVSSWLSSPLQCVTVQNLSVWLVSYHSMWLIRFDDSYGESQYSALCLRSTSRHHTHFLSFTHSFFLSLSLCLTCTHTHTHVPMLSLSHTRTHTHKHTLIHFQTHMRAHTHTQWHTNTHTHTVFTISIFHAHTHTATHTHACIHTRTHWRTDACTQDGVFTRFKCNVLRAKQT